MAKNVRPTLVSSPPGPRYLTGSTHVCYKYCCFSAILQKFYEYILTSVEGPLSLLLYSPQYLRDRIDLLHKLVAIAHFSIKFSRYMALRAPVSKCQPRKMAKNVRPTLVSATPGPRYLTGSTHVCYKYCCFSAILQKFYEYILTSVEGPLSLLLYSPQYLRDRIDLLHSHYPEQ